MRNHISLFLVACLLLGLSFAAIAKGESDVDQLTETLVNRINSTLNPDKVMGRPVDIEGMKIIPLVSYGFGFGAGMEVSSEKSGSGTGGGGGGGVTPSSILVITKDGEIKVMSAKKGALSDILTAAMPFVMEAIKSKRIGKERGEVHKPEENLKKGGHEPLSGDQVRELIAGNTYRGSDLRSQWPNFAVYFSADGQMRGRGGDQTDYGKWWVTEDRYCRQWSKWGKGQEACKHVYKIGELVHWFTLDGKMDDLGVIEADNPDNL
jgi:uncharacterized spore protein YtfJ